MTNLDDDNYFCTPDKHLTNVSTQIAPWTNFRPPPRVRVLFFFVLLYGVSLCVCVSLCALVRLENLAFCGTGHLVVPMKARAARGV